MPRKPFVTGQYDSLIGDSSVRLFGREMWELALRAERDEAYRITEPGQETHSKPGFDPAVPPRRSANNFLIDQLKRKDARLARISSFSYQNEMFELVKPAIFLVHGEGTSVEYLYETPSKQRTLRNRPTYTERTGMVGQRGSFAPDIFMWIYDRADFTLRLDTESGSFDQVLLAYELGSGFATGSMQAAGTDPPPPPSARRRRWRRRYSDED